MSAPTCRSNSRTSFSVFSSGFMVAAEKREVRRRRGRKRCWSRVSRTRWSSLYNNDDQRRPAVRVALARPSLGVLFGALVAVDVGDQLVSTGRAAPGRGWTPRTAGDRRARRARPAPGSTTCTAPCRPRSDAPGCTARSVRLSCRRSRRARRCRRPAVRDRTTRRASTAR